jgi:acyl-coenzyme A thioesterase PaaI-like protein
MFGGCMASLADPIPALICARLFPGHAVWTRLLEIDFVHEGRTDLELRFMLDPARKSEIALELQQQGRSNPLFEYAYYDQRGRRCARIRNKVAIRRLDSQQSGGALVRKQ